MSGVKTELEIAEELGHVRLTQHTVKSPHLVIPGVKTGLEEIAQELGHVRLTQNTVKSPHLVMSKIKTEPGEITEELALVAQHSAGSHKNSRIETHSTKQCCSGKSEKVLLHEAKALNSVVPKTHAHKEKVAKYVCRLCIKDFGDAASLGYHIQAIHPSEYLPRNIARKRSARQCHSEGVDRSLYGCHLCLKIFSDAASLGEHVCVKHSGKVTQQEIEWALNLEMPVSKARVKPRHCHLCPEVFLSKSSFKEHIQTSHSETACCEEVGPSTSKQWGNDECMPNARHYACHLCPKQFNDRNTRQQHHRSAHSATGKKHSCRQKIHPCKHCSKTFHRKIDLTQHLLLHSGGQSFQCHLCPAVLSQKEGLMRHLQRHRGEKPFGCPHCGKRFLINAEVLIHVRTHTGERPYACDFCPAKFSARDNLRKHVATHTGIKPSVCPKCPRRFARAQDLKRHYRIHTGERPFACATCPKTFTRGNLLRDHVEAVHRPRLPQSGTSAEHSTMEP